MKDCVFTSIVNKLQDAGCVFAEEEAYLLISESQTQTDLESMVNLRVAGCPLEHIIGWTEFFGLRIAVDPGVFVPRRRTEFLVQQVLKIAQSGSVVVDLCCGTGAVGVAIATFLKQIELHAVDIDTAAVQSAYRNIKIVGGYVYEGNLYDPLPLKLKGSIDILVANAPYVPTKAIEFLPMEARIHEPREALDGGADGLDVHRRVASSAPLWLVPGGSLFVEVSELQTEQTVEIFMRNGLITQIKSSDELDATVIIGTRPALHNESNGYLSTNGE